MYPLLVTTCPAPWIPNPYAKSCLKIVKKTHEQETAETECQRMGATLAVFDSEEKMNWFFEWRRNNSAGKRKTYIDFKF